MARFKLEFTQVVSDFFLTFAFARVGNHPLFQWIDNWTSRSLSSFHCPGDAHGGCVILRLAKNSAPERLIAPRNGWLGMKLNPV